MAPIDTHQTDRSTVVHVNKSRIRWLTATLVALLAVLACTLYPFRFSFRYHPVRSIWDVLLIGIGPDEAPDIAENVLLFLPFGITLAGYLENKTVRADAAVLVVLFLSFSISYVVEVLQLFMPGRFSSVTDVVSNTAGGGLGLLVLRAFRSAISNGW
jgi:VanZ family protein